jgi:hypothetical protein
MIGDSPWASYRQGLPQVLLISPIRQMRVLQTAASDVQLFTESDIPQDGLVPDELPVAVGAAPPSRREQAPTLTSRGYDPCLCVGRFLVVHCVPRLLACCGVRLDRRLRPEEVPQVHPDHIADGAIQPSCDGSQRQTLGVGQAEGDGLGEVRDRLRFHHGHVDCFSWVVDQGADIDWTRIARRAVSGGLGFKDGLSLPVLSK